MGRTFPNGDNYNATHIIISTSFFIACIAATFAIITSLCGFSRKKTTPPQNTPQAETTTASLDNDVIQPQSSSSVPLDNDVTQPQSDIIDSSSQPHQQQPLPPPPGRRHLSGAASYHVRSDSATSSHITSTTTTTTTSSNQPSSRSMSMSMRINGIGLSSRQLLGSKREDNKKEKNLKHEDSIWKKTIILGDKCRVPDEDDDDAIVYDEKGNRISTYHHRKHTNSMALSRQGSAIDQDAIPSSTKHDDMIDDESRN